MNYSFTKQNSTSGYPDVKVIIITACNINDVVRYSRRYIISVQIFFITRKCGAQARSLDANAI